MLVGCLKALGKTLLLAGLQQRQHKRSKQCAYEHNLHRAQADSSASIHSFHLDTAQKRPADAFDAQVSLILYAMTLHVVDPLPMLLPMPDTIQRAQAMPA
jgi:hypothetical protein